MHQLLSKKIRHRSPFACVLLEFFYVTAFKISLIYVQSCEKINPTQIHKHRPKIRFKKLIFVILDRYLDRQLSVEICCELSRGVEKLLSLSIASYRELLRGQKVARQIDLAIERYRDCDKKKLKSSINSLAVKRCRAIEL